MKILRSRPNACIMVAVAVVVCAVAPLRPNWIDLTVLTGIMSLIALSVGLSYGQAGILSIAQGGFAAIGAYATAIFTTRYGLSPYFGFLIAITLPAVLAWGVARMVSRLAPLATALATLAMGTLVEIVARSWDKVTGGFVGIVGIPPVPGFHQPAVFNVLVWGLVCVAVLAYENLMRSAHGRALNAVRHDRARATADGVNVPPLASAVLALSAAIAGAGGWLYAHYIAYMSPQSLDNTTSISVLLMAVVGGTGYILGPILGTVLLTILGHLLPAQEAQGLFYGGTLVLILLVAREGLMGGIQRLAVRYRMRVPAAAEIPGSPGATGAQRKGAS